MSDAGTPKDNPVDSPGPGPKGKAADRRRGKKGVAGAKPFDVVAEAAARVEATPQAGPPAGEAAAAPDIFKARDRLIETLGIEPGKPFYSTSLTEPHRLSEVIGIGVGFRFTRRTLTHETVIKVFVTEKLRESDLPPGRVIPEFVDGFRTDVEESAPGRPHSVGPAFVPQAFPVPVKCGVACGVQNASETGTIGCLVQMKNGDVCILSNNHVLAYATAENSPTKPELPGQLYKVFQAGPDEGNLIGLLEDYVPYKFAEPNYADAAVAKTSSDLTRVVPEHMTYSVSPTTARAAPGMTVMKDGMRTGASIGVVTDVGVQHVLMTYPNVGPVYFDEVVVIRGVGNAPFSLPGDSGSLIVTLDAKQPVALLVGGPEGQNLTYANPIDIVMAELGIARILSPDDIPGA